MLLCGGCGVVAGAGRIAEEHLVGLWGSLRYGEFCQVREQDTPLGVGLCHPWGGKGVYAVRCGDIRAIAQHLA